MAAPEALLVNPRVFDNRVFSPWSKPRSTAAFMILLTVCQS
jgi:hypothetical protein